MMNEIKHLKQIVIVSLLILTSLNTIAQKNTNQRAKWFTDARFGMFIHWGVYSGAEGIWKGEKLRYDNDYAEWIYYRNRIHRDEYVTLLDRFDWKKIDPEKWVILAKEAGMKYVTITAKHHDGFALWDSNVGNYDVAKFTNPKRDIIKELAEACKKHGLKLGLYYSHWVDWAHPNGWDHTKEIYLISAQEYDKYWQEKVMPQMRELLTNYGDIGLIWFDMWIHHSKSIVTKKQLLQLKKMIRKLQPNCLVNSRLGLSVEEDSDIDFKTLGDNELGSKKEEFPWQSPGTVAHSWGFHALEEQWKSTSTLLHWLINNASLNGNYMLNIGPRANGDVPYEISQRLLEMGKWLKVNGESIYGAEAFDLRKDQHDWGKITCRKMVDGKAKLYLHLYNWPLSKKVFVTGIKSKPAKAYLLANKQKLDVKLEGALTTVDLPSEAPGEYVAVVVLEYNSYPETIDNLVGKTVDRGYSLTPKNSLNESELKIVNPKRFGSIPEHVKVSRKQEFQWKIYVEQPKTLHIDASYSFQGNKDDGTIELSMAKSNRKLKVKPTGLTVGEPNSDWHIPNFDAHRMGTIEITEPGYYTINMKVKSSDKHPILFQWIWLGE
ncbi:alpha-L-fucosidase [Prolixibacteraceae bacterium JC049]|nr:alpha-L-fucosidase [Prolixibacteraceae bacterium JC049]